VEEVLKESNKLYFWISLVAWIQESIWSYKMQKSTFAYEATPCYSNWTVTILNWSTSLDIGVGVNICL